MKQSLVFANYTVACLAMVGILLCWVQYWEAKEILRNPLIPARLAEIHYKPAALYTVVFAVVIALQLVSVHFKKGHLALAVFGVVALAAGWALYPHVVGWFL